MSEIQRTADVEELMAHTEWVWRLARSLVVDDPSADDVVADTWVIALERPPGRIGPQDGLAGWLAKVVRRVAGRHRRTAQRRGAREARAARSEQLPPAERVLEMEESRRKLIAALMGLPDPYKCVLILRYYDGLGAAAIARRVGGTASGVRTRLARGHTLLRERLQRDHRESGTSWLSAIGPLAWHRPGEFGVWAVLTSTKAIVAAAAGLLMVFALIWNLTRSGPGIRDVSPASSSLSADSPSERGAVTEARTAAIEPSGPKDPRDRTPIEATDGGFQILVVEAATGEPVEGAEVWCAAGELNTSYWPKVTQFENPDIEELVIAHGRRAITDARGVARLPAGLPYSHFSARSGTRWGLISGSPREGETLPVSIGLDRDLVVQAVSPDLAPLEGVEVTLSMRQGSHADGVWWARTGANGLVRVRHFDHWIRRGLLEGKVPVVAVASPLAEPIERVLDPRARLPEPVQLILPETAAVTVLLQDESGQPLIQNTWVQLRANRHLDLTDDPRYGPWWSRYTTASRAVFHDVGVGLRLELNCAPGDGFSPMVREIEGPSASGESIEVVLRLERGQAVLTGRLVDLAGQSIDPRPGLVWVDSVGGEDRQSESAGHLLFASDGRFRAPLRRPDLPGKLVDLRFELYSVGDLKALSGTQRGVQLARRGDTDVGEVEVSSAPLVVAGRVIGSDGNPVSEAAIGLMRWERLGPGSESETWNHFQRIPNTAAEDGTFEVRETLAPGSYALYVRQSGYLASDPIPFQLGSSGLLVQLQQEGLLEGHVLVDPGIPSEALCVSFVWGDRSSPDPGKSSRRVWLTPGGDFRLNELWPGRGSLLVHLQDEDGAVASVADLTVPSGSIATDSRLHAIDLRSRVWKLELELVDLAGKPVPAGHVAVRPSQTPGSWARRVAFEQGRLILVESERPVDLEVWAAGYRTCRLSAVDRDQRAILEPGLEILVSLPSSIELPRDEQRLVVSLVKRSPGPSVPENIRSTLGDRVDLWIEGQRHYAGVFDAARQARLLLPEPGVYDVSWILRSHEEGEVNQQGIRSDADACEATVPGDTGVLILELGPELEDYRRVLGSG